MPKLVKEPEDITLVQKFVKQIHEEMKLNQLSHTFDYQEIFNTLMDGMKDNQGTIYLCFNCGSVLQRSDMTKQTYFQLTGVWHPCEDVFGMPLPTPGFFSRFNTVVKYIKKAYGQWVEMV